MYTFNSALWLNLCDLYIVWKTKDYYLYLTHVIEKIYLRDISAFIAYSFSQKEYSSFPELIYIYIFYINKARQIPVIVG